MKVVIPGGSGQVGTILARAFQRDGHEVVVLSRTARRASWGVVTWDATTSGPWVKEIDGADVVINLAGRSVNCRSTPRNREAIKRSRVRSTQVVGDAIAAAKRPPPLWLQASTATIYAHRYDAAVLWNGIGAERLVRAGALASVAMLPRRARPGR